ncbi:MAG: phenylalanine--tRNA ligase subunit alpha [Bacteroidales bacterium]|jgi:phenylalanyl-tRNA synthetase alpha chain|nr:phenylalanine--tRNA ligase subunit alpha [Bacteroidales bacterium]MDD3690750.1 phenylalanine--tRNA ligase subunit alpha [Bacteroidales bacterium]MDX9889699.1 phenylalanine--tRNA ligase subunit alpha [Bacteroidales bacterium]NLO42856.1 phenylalanine--tRNA ligase subunit alpha [Bacteroidales bacterium]
MTENLENYHEEIRNFITDKLDELDQFRLKFLGKKGILVQLFEQIKEIPPAERKDFGKDINILKSMVLEKVNVLKNQIESTSNSTYESMDLSRPANCISLGSRHPLSIVSKQISDVFKKIGYTIAEGPEIEDDWHNFEALNFEANHPARDMQDTFFIDKDILLRTHTSPVQVRVMENHKPPLRAICPGRVFRNEAITARSHCIFHQIEILCVDTNISFADMRQTLEYFVKEIFGPDRKTRLRPSYFPFTEPSAEMDISCDICHGKGCNICKNTGWVEILGCGMVDPNVLHFVGIDPLIYSGFAIGMGIERITQQLYKTKDIRLFFENDLRFLKQFVSI